MRDGCGTEKEAAEEWFGDWRCCKISLLGYEDVQGEPVEDAGESEADGVRRRALFFAVQFPASERPLFSRMR